MMEVTCTAPINIAVIKYWGKRDEKLILPINGSTSATLDQSQLCAKTTVAVSPDFTADQMWLNGEEQSMESSRLQNVLKEIRRRAKKRKCVEDSGDDTVSWHVHICSENNFPTAAGLASSAAGLACLVFSLAKLFRVEGDISDIARQGSGSACRSIYGGFVEWTMGIEVDGSDSRALQIAPETHWPQMRVLILVVSAKKKHVGSTAGMQTSVKTSDLVTYRAEKIVPQRMVEMRRAIKDRDFQTFADITIKESNQLHACCLDTFPPIFYMTDTSRDIVRLVHAVNSHFGENKVAYTFDAGPNACLYLMEDMVPMMLGLVQTYFPPEQDHGEGFLTGLPSKIPAPSQELLNAMPLEPSVGAIQYIIHTKVGTGPQVLTDPSDSLLDTTGQPKSSTQ
ncbi:Diphosphomevalonate decarboxylase [Lamellibrachia satsuma]|nr:Diphosphomevalonate decarboxylase [Lamellibrachia satsuma]